MAGLGTKGKLGIIFALREEQEGLDRVLAESRSETHLRDGGTAWLVGQLEVHATVSGVGRSKCAKATEMLIDQGAQWIIAAGFAAALDPVAQVGDVVAVDRVILGSDNRQPVLCSDRALLMSLPPSGANAGFPIRCSDLITVDSIVGNSEQKEAIFRSTGAGALDMESYAAAKVCYERGIPFAAIRSVSDCATDEIPNSVAALISIDSRWRQFFYVASRPLMWGRILDMRRNAYLAANNLADVLGWMLLRMI
ncbi:MAG: phosphorylase family protein [Armatimonadota bacterium]